jgi:hypothetical protein
MLNRSAIIVRPQPPFIKWIHDTDPEGCDPQPDDEPTIYLVPDVEDERVGERILREVWPEIFERELDAWYTDESLWPQNRTLAMFEEWFKVEWHSIIEDLCDGAITSPRIRRGR